MNEEFGFLKDMIPACESMEMPKLGTLQAGIEYVRYLEGCLARLKAENDKKGTINVKVSMRLPLFPQTYSMAQRETDMNSKSLAALSDGPGMAEATAGAAWMSSIANRHGDGKDRSRGISVRDLSSS